MSKIRAGIFGIGSKVPEKILTNNDLSKIVDTSDEWIRTRTGIRERRIADEKTATSDLAFPAAQAALEMAKMKAEEIDLIITATSSPDLLFPSTACIIQDKLKAPQAAAFDLSAACSGFVYGLATATQFIENGTYKNILLIGADTLAKYVDWTDRNTCVLFGDAAGAVVLKPTTDGSGVLASKLGAEGDKGHVLTMPGGGSRHSYKEIRADSSKFYIAMEGKEVFKFAVRVLESSVRDVVRFANLQIENINLLVPHQANIRIVDHAAKKLKLPKEKVYVNLEKYGNTSAASVPLALDEALREGKIKKGDIIAVTGFGAGLTYGAAAIKWSI